MKNRSNDLKTNVLRAQSQSEVADLLKEAGMDETRAESLWNEVRGSRESRELSRDELSAVSGGADRDWITDGCAATVEPNSLCRTNDACWKWDVTYDHEPTFVTCPHCGSYMYVAKIIYATNPSDDTVWYQCPKCGYRE